jgi:type II secretory pathway pseudopilin PulG
MVELILSLTLLLVLTAIAVPTMMTSVRSYQLNDSAMRLSDILKFTRFEAVRQNRPVSALIQLNGTTWTIGTDSNRNNLVDPSEKQLIFTGFATLLPPGGLPSSSSILSALNVPALDSSRSGSPGLLTFDARGASSVGAGPPVTYVFYIGSATNPEFGYRAVILLPVGSTQVWSAPSAGPWVRVN